MSQPKIKSEAIDLESLPLTGIPTAPTASAGTNTTQLATTAFVYGEVTIVLNAFSTVVSEPGAATTALPITARQYTRFTNTATKTYTFDSAQTYNIGTEYVVRNVGAGDLTLVAAGTFTLNPPAGSSLVVVQGNTVTIKIVGAAEADVV